MNAYVALASAIALSLAIVSLPRLARAEEVDKIVASVDGDPITLHEVRAFAESAGRRFIDDPTGNETFKEGLKGMIAQKLLAQEVSKYNDKIDDAQIDRYIIEVEQERNISDQQLKQSLMQSDELGRLPQARQGRELAKATVMLNEELRQRVTIPPEEIRTVRIATGSPSSRRNISSRKF